MHNLPPSLFEVHAQYRPLTLAQDACPIVQFERTPDEHLLDADDFALWVAAQLAAEFAAVSASDGGAS